MFFYLILTTLGGSYYNPHVSDKKQRLKYLAQSKT